MSHQILHKTRTNEPHFLVFLNVRRLPIVEPLLEALGEIDLTEIDLSGIDWAIVGGESGAGARPMQAEWVENIQRQCESARVPFFFKQWGGVRKKLAGRELNGRTYDEHPAIVRGEMPDRVRRKEVAGEFEIVRPISSPALSDPRRA